MTPQSLDQIKIWRVGRKVNEFNLELFGESLNKAAFLITGIIQKQGHDFAGMFGGQGMKQVANTERVDIRVVGNRHHFTRHRIQCPKDIEPLSPRSGIDKEALKAPEETEEGLQDKMRSIDEVHLLATVFSVVQIAF